MRAFALSLLLLCPSVATVHAANPATQVNQAHDVVMYTTKSCGYCAHARQYFTERGIRWTEIDIESSAAAAAKFEALGGIGTPLIFIDKQRIMGFDQQQIENALSSPQSRLAPEVDRQSPKT